jgi:hypothetical protein
MKGIAMVVKESEGQAAGYLITKELFVRHVIGVPTPGITNTVNSYVDCLRQHPETIALRLTDTVADVVAAYQKGE